MGEKQKIAWIGAGKMGFPMCRNLIMRGYSVTVYDVLEERRQELAGIGAKAAQSMGDAVAGADVVISSIPDDRALDAIALGPDSAFEAARPGLTYIDMSTVSPSASMRCAEAADLKKIGYLRAPVSGSTTLAAAATLTIFVSGPKTIYDHCEVILGCMGQKVFYVGGGEEARYLKLVMNMMVGLTSAMVAEALTFGEAGGMEWEEMIDIINASVVSSPLFGYKAGILKKRDFTPAFTAAQMAKDFDLMLHVGKVQNIPMPFTALVRQFYGALMASGRGERDFFSLVTLLEEMSGLGEQRQRKAGWGLR